MREVENGCATGWRGGLSFCFFCFLVVAASWELLPLFNGITTKGDIRAHRHSETAMEKRLFPATSCLDATLKVNMIGPRCKTIFRESTEKKLWQKKPPEGCWRLPRALLFEMLSMCGGPHSSGGIVIVDGMARLKQLT